MKSDLEEIEKEIRYLEIHMLDNHHNKSMDYVKGYLNALNNLDLKIKILKDKKQQIFEYNIPHLIGNLILGFMIGTIIGMIIYPIFNFFK